MNDLIEKPKIRTIPEIDGLRAVAIMQVLCFHLYTYLKYKTNYGSYFSNGFFVTKIFQNGHQGVELFFVISGFIIALPFIKGKDLSPVDFYRKRLVRILPPYYFTLGLLLLLYLFQEQKDTQLLIKQFFVSMAFLSNIILDKSQNITPVGWSLEIEVQFYLLLPLIYIILRAESFYLYSMLVLIIGFGPLLSYGLDSIDDHPTLLNYMHFFALGILIAKLYVTDKKISFGNFFDLLLGLIALCCVILGTFNSSIIGSYLFMISLFVLFYFTLNGGVLKDILGHRILATIGLLSFSLYLVHYQLIAVTGQNLFKHVFIKDSILNLILSVFLIVSTTIIGAYIFYIFVEKKICNFFVEKTK